MIKKKLKKPELNRILLFLSISIVLQSCTKNLKNVENDIFKFSCNFSSIKNDKTGQFSGCYILNNTDSLFYNIGFTVHNLSDKIPSAVFIPNKEQFLFDPNIDTTGVVFEKRKDFDIDKYKKQNVNFEYSGNQIWKYTFPIDTSKGGIIGIYVDSIATGELGVLQFNAFTNCSSKGNNLNLINLIKTIRLQAIKEYDYYKSTIYIH
ncbi:hypothetical protein BH10BAC2_BH10BAC2_25210 [soil metagenome]